MEEHVDGLLEGLGVDGPIKVFYYDVAKDACQKPWYTILHLLVEVYGSQQLGS